MAGLIGLLAYAGAPPLGKGVDDTAIFLNAGWRIFNHQTPHHDFTSIYGALVFYFVALGMHLVHPSVSAILYGNLLFSALIGLWSWHIGRSRLTPGICLLFSFTNVFCVLGSMSLGMGINETSFAMLYNRYGFALLNLFWLDLFLSPRQENRSTNFSGEGISAGILLFLILISKINFFGIALLSLFPAIICRLLSWRKLGFLVFSFVLTALLFAVILHLDLRAYYQDVKLAASLQDTHTRLFRVLFTVFTNLIPIAIVLAPLVLFAGKKEIASGGLDQISYWIPILTIVIGGVVICATNTQTTQIPSIFLGLLVWMENMRRRSSNSPGSHFSQQLGLVLLVPLVAGFLLTDALGVGYSMASSLKSRPVPGSPLKDLRLGHFGRRNPLAVEYIDEVTAGMELLKKHSFSPGDRISALDYTNVYSLLTETTPPRGEVLALDGYSFTEKIFPAPERLLGDITLLLIPRADYVSAYPQNKLLRQLYQPYINSHFSLVDQNAIYELWTRSNQAQ